MGLREDKAAQDVRIEKEQAVREIGLRSEVAGVTLSTPERVYFPEVGVTKSELAQYYERVADRMLPTLVQRPLSLVRCPEGWTGECFYQKRADRGIPERVGRVVVKKGREPYAMVEDLPSVVSLVQIGVLEFHVWGARADRLDRPDIVVFDLDPDPSVAWRMVADTAKLLRGLLEELGLVAFVRSTGGKGLHVVVPLQRRSTWEQVKEFAHGIATKLVEAAPDRFTAKMTKSKRRGKIFIDTFRNDPESTAIASWSVRARERAPIAAPLAWGELDADDQPLFTVRDVEARMARPDPWADFEASRRALTKAMVERVR
jgi:bifunctional non-homologous end joining protein LigD